MIDTNRLNHTLQEVLDRIQSGHLSTEEAIVLWGAIGELIFGGGGLRGRREAYDQMIQYLQDNYRGHVGGPFYPFQPR